MEGVTSPPGTRNSPQSSSFLSPLLISMVGIVATSVAIIVYHLFLVKYCLRWRQQEPVNVAARAVSMASAGVEKKVLEAIPVLAFSAVKSGGQYLRLDVEECVVCLGEIEDEDKVRLLPKCKHAFHVPCIDQWFLSHTSCPLCRSPILTDDNPGEIQADTAPTSYNPGHEEAYYTPDNTEPTLPSVRRSGLLRHCMSLELPHTVAMMKSPPRSVVGLHRSVSMDPIFDVINIQNEDEIRVIINPGTAGSSSRGKLKRSESYRARPLNQIDRMLRSSFSRLRLGKGTQVGPILPY